MYLNSPLQKPPCLICPSVEVLFDYWKIVFECFKIENFSFLETKERMDIKGDLWMKDKFVSPTKSVSLQKQKTFAFPLFLQREHILDLLHIIGARCFFNFQQVEGMKTKYQNSILCLSIKSLKNALNLSCVLV